MGASIVALAILAPWLVWLPAVNAPASVVLASTVAIVAALHGWGRLVARLANRDDASAALAVQWGVAAVVAVAGIMLALQRYDARLLIIAGTGMHSADLALRFAALRDRVTPALLWRSAKFWIVPAFLLVVVALVNVLGAAGQVTARAFDDETNVIAQFERLASTGALADVIGFPRQSQLGGHITLGALASAFGDAQLGRVVDRGIGLLLFLFLVCSRVQPRDPGSTIWSSLLVVLAASFTTTSPDLVPLWIPAGLILGLYLTVGTSTSSAREMLPIGLVAGALCVVRSELAPIGLVMIALTWWAKRQHLLRDWRRNAALLGSLTIVVVPYVLAARLDVAAVDPHAHVLLASRAWPLIARIGLFVVIACALAPLLLLAVRELEDRPLRWLALATTAAIAGVASRLFGKPPGAIQQMWPIALAAFAALAIIVASQTTLRRTTMVVAVLGCMLIYEARTAPRRAWSWRYVELLFDVQYARDRAPRARIYDAVLATVPAGEAVAVWVASPERLDYARNTIVDLRTPGPAKSNALEKLVRASRARWLLVDQDSRSSFPTLLAAGRLAASTSDVQLVELR